MSGKQLEGTSPLLTEQAWSTQGSPLTSLSRTSIKWSFAKSTRFTAKHDPTQNVMLPGPSNTMNARTTSMGFGGRTKYNPPLTPAPNCYDPVLSSTSKLMTFSKNDSLPAFLKTAFASSKDIPGPGSYTLDRGFLFKKKGYLLKSRNPQLDPYKNTPGPGQYQPSTQLVRRKLYAGVSFGSGQRTEFTTRESKHVPGPGTYSLPTKHAIN